MIDVAVCDDEKNIRTYICSLIQKQGTECRITEYASADEYLLAGAAHNLLFLDIEMKSDGEEDKNGMWLVGQLCSMELARQPVIIFVTGYEKYVYDAFYVGAFQYLLKPINEEKFSQVFKRAVRQIAAERESMLLVTIRVLKNAEMDWRDALLFFAYSLSGGVLAGIVSELYAVKVGDAVFYLYDAKKEMFWKIPRDCDVAAGTKYKIKTMKWGNLLWQ